MVSKKEDTIDFYKLEDEVNAAVEAEARYYRENDAKFRAIEQKVESYEEFRDIVLASHLKPLEKGDRLDNIKFIQPWNQTADTSLKTSSTVQNYGGENKLSKKPANGHEFGRDWRRVCKTSSDKYAFLLWLGSDAVTKLFKTEISFGLLGDIITALHKEYQSEHLREVAAILKSLSSANRFKLAVDFLSSVEKDTCQKLFDQISEDMNIVNGGERKNHYGNESESQGHVAGTESESQTVAEMISCVPDLTSLRKLYGLET